LHGRSRRCQLGRDPPENNLAFGSSANAATDGEGSLEECFDAAAGRRWYAVRTQPRKEYFAEKQIQRQGFKTFLPHVSAAGGLRNPSGAKGRPFFPSYLFISLILSSDRWHSINGTFGVQKIVAFGGRPSAVPHGFVEDLIALSTDKGEVRFRWSFDPGDAVRIVGGPLNGHIGLFEAMRPNERVNVLLEILGQKTRINLEHAAIMPA